MEDSQMLQASYEQDQAHCNYFDYAPTTTETVLSMNLSLPYLANYIGEDCKTA